MQLDGFAESGTNYGCRIRRCTVMGSAAAAFTASGHCTRPAQTSPGEDVPAQAQPEEPHRPANSSGLCWTAPLSTVRPFQRQGRHRVGRGPDEPCCLSGEGVLPRLSSPGRPGLRPPCLLDLAPMSACRRSRRRRPGPRWNLSIRGTAARSCAPCWSGSWATHPPPRRTGAR